MLSSVIIVAVNICKFICFNKTILQEADDCLFQYLSSEITVNIMLKNLFCGWSLRLIIYGISCKNIGALTSILHWKQMAEYVCHNEINEVMTQWKDIYCFSAREILR